MEHIDLELVEETLRDLLSRKASIVEILKAKELIVVDLKKKLEEQISYISISEGNIEDKLEMFNTLKKEMSSINTRGEKQASKIRALRINAFLHTAEWPDEDNKDYQREIAILEGYQKQVKFIDKEQGLLVIHIDEIKKSIKSALNIRKSLEASIANYESIIKEQKKLISELDSHVSAVITTEKVVYNSQLSSFKSLMKVCYFTYSSKNQKLFKKIRSFVRIVDINTTTIKWYSVDFRGKIKGKDITKAEKLEKLFNQH